MEKHRYKFVQGDVWNIAFLNVALPIIEDEFGAEKYEITKSDLLEFSIGRKDRIPIVRKTYPGEIEKDGDTFFVHLTAEETERFPLLYYRMRLKIDLEGLGEEVYTLVDKALEVVAK